MRRLNEIKRDAEQMADIMPEHRINQDRIDLVALVERLRDAMVAIVSVAEVAERNGCDINIEQFTDVLDRARAALAAADGTDAQTARDESANPPACDCAPIKTHVGWTIHQPGCATNKTARDDGQGA